MAANGSVSEFIGLRTEGMDEEVREGGIVRSEVYPAGQYATIRHSVKHRDRDRVPNFEVSFMRTTRTAAQGSGIVAENLPRRLSTSVRSRISAFFFRFANTLFSARKLN